MFHLLPHILMPSAQRECFLLLTKKDIAFQRCLFCSLGIAHKKKTLLFSDVSFVRSDLLTKKRHCFFSDVSLFAWDCSQKKDIAFQRCLFCSLGAAHKKETLLFSDVSFGCPMGLEPMTFRTTI